jgi:hypothetical protein
MQIGDAGPGRLDRNARRDPRRAGIQQAEIDWQVYPKDRKFKLTFRLLEQTETGTDDGKL